MRFLFFKLWSIVIVISLFCFLFIWNDGQLGKALIRETLAWGGDIIINLIKGLI